MGLLLFLFPIVEVYLLIKVGSIIGAANIFFYLLASIVFGIGLIRSQGAFLIRNMQAQLAKGEAPTNAIVHSLLIFAAGALFAFPGLISEVIGLLLLLPGSRHFAATLVKRKFEAMVRKGSVRFASSGFSAGWRPGPMRDVSPLEIDSQSNGEIIDVTPSKKE
jgi:UPF0716 protein FxsA